MQKQQSHETTAPSITKITKKTQLKTTIPLTPPILKSIIVIVDSGCEDACALEIKRWLPKAEAIVREHQVELQGTLHDAAMLGYRLQTARRVVVRVLPTFKKIEDIHDKVFPKNLIDEMFSATATYKLEAEVLTQHPKWRRPKPQPMTQEVIDEVGNWCYEQLVGKSSKKSSDVKKSDNTELDSKNLDSESHNSENLENGRKVDLKRPDIILYALVSELGVDIGVDVVGIPLARREYRIILQSQRGMKATVAAATIIYAEATSGKILDPMPGDGIFAIEAALMRTRTSPRKHQRVFSASKFPALVDDKSWRDEKDRVQDRDILAFAANMKEMKAVRTNSKLASVDDAILATKISVDWMDVKLDAKSIDRIITSPPASGKSLMAKDAAKIQDQLFNQAEYILKTKGTMTCVTEKPEEIITAAAKYNLIPQKKITVLMGKRDMTIIIFAKVKKE